MALEISLAHQQRLCEQLNEVVTDHTRVIFKLQTELTKQEGQLKSLRLLADKQAEPLPDERPPHY